MDTWWSADYHMGHPNIIVYANRPWLKEGDLLVPHIGGKPMWASREIALERAEQMNTWIIRETNMRCKPGDILMHIGDWSCYGNERGIEGTKTKGHEWEAKLNPRVIHVLGNHDKANHVKGAGMRACVCKLGHWYCWVQHVPPWNPLAIKAPDICTAYICGHVHDAWQLEQFEGKPVVNVGLDANKLRPLKQTEVIHLIKQAQDLKKGESK